MSDERELRETLAKRTGTQADDWHLTFRTRHGMLAVLRTLAQIRGGGTVVTQLFTCCTAVDPIMAAGLVPAYGDLDPATLALDAERLPLAPDTVAIVDQHTFGIIDDDASAQLRSRAHDAGALLLEDSAHCAGRIARDAEGVPLADVSFHSFGVGKMATSDFGGAVWLSPRMEASLRERIAQELDELPAFDERLERACRGYGLSIRILMHLPRALRRALWDPLAKARLFVPAVSNDERRGQVSYEPQRIGGFALEDMARGLEGLSREEDRSREACAVFAEAFAPLADELGIPSGAREAAPLLQFPLVLKDEGQADGLIEALCEGGCYCEAWGRPLLFPGALDEAAYHMPDDLTGLPVTQRVSQGVVPLLTCVSPTDALKAADIVINHLYGRS